MLSFASTSAKQLTRAVTAGQTRSNHLRPFSTSSSLHSEPVVPDTTPVTPPTPDLPASPLPAAYRSPTNSSSANSTTPLPTPYRSRSTAFDLLSNSASAQGSQAPYTLNIFTSRNNTILTLTTPSSTPSDDEPSPPSDLPVAWVSAGSAGYKGASRGTYDAAVEVSIRMFKKIAEINEPNFAGGMMKKKEILPRVRGIEMRWNGFGQGRDAVFRTLMSGEGDRIRGWVTRVTDATPLKVGGTRPKKRRV